MNMMRKTSGLPLSSLPNCKFGAKTFLIDHLIVYDLPVVYIGIETINQTQAEEQRRGVRWQSRHGGQTTHPKDWLEAHN